MKKRSNFTPMKRFHEILDNYGLKLMKLLKLETLKHPLDLALLAENETV